MFSKFKLVITGFYFTILLAACQPFQALEYRGVSDWDIKFYTLAESKLSAKVSVYNPNKHAITVKRVEADIQVNGTSWGNYIIDSAFVLPAKDVFTLPLNLKVKNAQLVSGGLNFVNGGQLPFKLIGKVKGKYRGIGAEVPFEHVGNFSDKDIKEKSL